ncbi:hypothetical protein D3C81_2082250 [compost metagenome]
MAVPDNRYIDTMRYLAKRGIDIHAKDNNGESALDYFTRYENTEMIHFINSLTV